jgi:uncharacterized membrane protein
MARVYKPVPPLGAEGASIKKGSAMNKVRNLISGIARRYTAMMVFLAIAMFSLSARADTDVTALVTSAETLWGTVKTLVLGVLGFLILIAIVKLVKKR